MYRKKLKKQCFHLKKKLLYATYKHAKVTQKFRKPPIDEKREKNLSPTSRILSGRKRLWLGMRKILFWDHHDVRTRAKWNILVISFTATQFHIYIHELDVGAWVRSSFDHKEEAFERRMILR